MFGSSFFFIQSCSNVAVLAPCILAVNQNGLNFLSIETHVSGLSLALPLAPSPLSPTLGGAEIASWGCLLYHLHLCDPGRVFTPL